MPKTLRRRRSSPHSSRSRAFQFDARFSTWLYRIAVNKCTDSLRARRPHDVSLDASEDDQSASVASGRTGNAAVGARAGWSWQWELDQGIQALPHVYRESFVLRHIEGLGYDEMSAILGVHRDTLKMRVYKARTLLCQSLVHLRRVRM